MSKVAESIRRGCTPLPGAGHPVHGSATNPGRRMLLEDVKNVLRRTGLPPHALELENTESIALGNDDEVLAFLRTLRAIGVGLAFDDFGTGYASLSYLMRYPLTRIKIDRSFVQKIGENAAVEDTAIVRSIITMGHNLGFAVTAEGVETRAQATFLQAEKCDEGQGFLYAKPIPAADFEGFLRQTLSVGTIPISSVALRAKDCEPFRSMPLICILRFLRVCPGTSS